jgi:Na+(H+)/acetate symporter ActP
MVGVEHLVGKSWVVKRMVDQDVVVGVVVGQIVVAVELLRLE